MASHFTPQTHTRRTFLGGMAAAAAVPSVLSAQGNSPKRQLGIALVGLGSLSTNQIAPALQKTRFARLAGVVSGTPSKVKAWQEKYGIPEKNCYDYASFDRIRDNPDIDLVYIVLPNSMHAEYTIRAARAGKHVLCEKPMANSVRDCQDMIAACKDAKRRLAIGYRCQFTPHHLEMIRLARYEEFGPVRLIEAGLGFRIGDPTQWRLRRDLAGGGALMDVGIYALQGCRYTLGEEPIEVTAVETKTDKVKFAEVDESIFWTMRFPSGAMAHCGTTYLTGGMNYLKVMADRGVFQLTSAYGYTGLAGGIGDNPSKLKPFDLPQVDHFAAEMDDFAECIMRNKPTRASGEEGLADMKVIEAIYRSIAEGRTVKV